MYTTLQIKYKIAVAKNRNNTVKHVTLCLRCNSARIYGESISYNINCILYDIKRQDQIDHATNQIKSYRHETN